MSMMTHLEMFTAMEKAQKEAKRLAARVAELAEKLTTSRWQEQIHADNCAKAEADRDRLREALDKAMAEVRRQLYRERAGQRFADDHLVTVYSHSCQYCGAKKEGGHADYCLYRKLAALAGPAPEGGAL